MVVVAVLQMAAVYRGHEREGLRASDDDVVVVVVVDDDDDDDDSWWWWC
jgi:hypothetical protein